MSYYHQELTEEEQVARAREERLQIVARYDQGREEGAVIDDWEDPKFEIYHTQDRFGFIHDHRLAENGKRTEEERKSLEKEMSRVDKWLKMLKEQHKWFPRGSKYYDKMMERTWKGVPERMRGSLWRILLNLDQIKAEQEGKYQEMKDLARRHSPDIRQIDLDVNRTYRNHIMFRERYNTRQQDLFHVLGAYSIYNSEVGYCQGMSQIAALLLMYLNDDEDAFWALSQLMVGRKWNMHGFFIPQFPKLMRFQEHHDKILMKKLRRLQKHMIANGVETGIYTLKWFFQCFLDRIPFSLTIRVWDLYLLEGETIMFAMAYTILKLHRKALLKMGMDELLEFLQKTMENDFGYDDDYVIETALKECLAELRSSRLHTAGPPPENEKPQKPFGLHNFPTVEEEAARSRREPFSEKERLFSEETVRRGEEQSRRLALLNSQTSIDDGSLGSVDEVDEIVSSPKSRATPSLPPSPHPTSREQDELDDSLQFMMHQAKIDDDSEGRSSQQSSRRADKEKRKEFEEREQRRLGEVRRPASAEPNRSVHEVKRGDGGKRLSAYGHISVEPTRYGDSRSHSQSKSSFSASRSSMTGQTQDISRTSGTSSELTNASSRALNTSNESQASRASPRLRHSQRNSSRDLAARSQSRKGRESNDSGGRKTRDQELESGRRTRDQEIRSYEQESGDKMNHGSGDRSYGSGEGNHGFGDRSRGSGDRTPVSGARGTQELISGDKTPVSGARGTHELMESGSKKSYYFGEEPSLSNGAPVEDGDDEITPTEERREVTTNKVEEEVREHQGEVVRIRVPYTEPDLTTSFNMQRLSAQRISPRFNGHKVTIQVNQNEAGSGRLDESFSSEPPLSPASRQWATSKISESQVTRRHISTSEKMISNSGELHKTTHSMFLSEHRQRRAPLAQPQDMDDIEDPGAGLLAPAGTNGTRHSSHRHSLNESYSSSSEGESRTVRTAQRHSSSSEYRDTSSHHVVETRQNVTDLRKETFF